MNGTTSATTTSGPRISMKPMNIANTPANRRIQVRMRFSRCAAANMSAADMRARPHHQQPVAGLGLVVGEAGSGLPADDAGRARPAPA